MHLNSHLAVQGKRFQEKLNQLSPGKRQYHVHYTIIEKTVSSALPARTIHTLRPKNAPFHAPSHTSSQTSLSRAPLSHSHTSFKKPVDYDFLPTYTSRQSISPKRPETAEGFSKRLKSRCQSAYSRTQALKQANQQRKAQRVFSSVGLLQERGKRGEEVYTLNLLRIHGTAENRIKINNLFM